MRFLPEMVFMLSGAIYVSDLERFCESALFVIARSLLNSLAFSNRDTRDLSRLSGTWRFDLDYVDRRIAGASGYNRVIRGRRTQEQMSAFRAAEHDGKHGSFCCYLLVDFTVLPDAQSL